jgi:hypothetical protein
MRKSQRKKENNMDWTQTLTIIVSLAGLIFWLHKDINRLESDVKALDSKYTQDMRAQSARTDQLYKMFVDLLKELKK